MVRISPQPPDRYLCYLGLVILWLSQLFYFTYIQQKMITTATVTTTEYQLRNSFRNLLFEYNINTLAQIHHNDTQIPTLAKIHYTHQLASIGTNLNQSSASMSSFKPSNTFIRTLVQSCLCLNKSLQLYKKYGYIFHLYAT